jgi:hypothetical protein
VQTINSKATQQPDGKKKQQKKGKGDKKPTDNDGRGDTKKKKSKYPYNLCKEDHPIHQCPRFVEAQNLLAQKQLSMLTNPFLHRKNLTQTFSSAEGGSERTPPSLSDPSSTNVYMMKGDAYIVTRAHDYGNPGTSKKSKEAENPPLFLRIENMLGETMMCIPKGVFKKSSYNPNARAA